jgi:hypothetical protein
LDESVKIRVCQIKFTLAWQNFPKCLWMKVTLSSKVLTLWTKVWLSSKVSSFRDRANACMYVCMYVCTSYKTMGPVDWYEGTYLCTPKLIFSLLGCHFLNDLSFEQSRYKTGQNSAFCKKCVFMFFTSKMFVFCCC